VGVVVAAGSLVEVGGPGAGVAGVAGEVGDGVAELLVAGPAEGDGAHFAGLAGGGCGAGEAGQGVGGGEPGAAVADLGEETGGAAVPERGRLVKMCWSACAASCSPIWPDRALIWLVRLVRTASRARVMQALAWPSAPVAPRGAAVRRACSTAGSVPPV